MMIAQFDAECVTQTGQERMHTALIIEQDDECVQLVAMGIVANLAMVDSSPELVKWFTLSSPTYVEGCVDEDKPDTITQVRLGQVIQRFDISDDPWNMGGE